MTARVLWCVVTLAVIVLAPVILLVGEPLRRYYVRSSLRRLDRQRCGVGWRSGGLARVVIANPVLIALTAPGRWAIDQVGRLSSGSSSGGDSPPSAGVREPRRPKPNTPAGAVALAEPIQRHRIIRIRKALPPALRRRGMPPPHARQA